MLTKNELKTLRKEIILNSLFLKDYSNSLYIKNDTVCAFMGGYLDYICTDNDALSYDEILKRYDNIDTLYNYYLLYEDDPLIKDDYIAFLNLSLFNGVVIYSVNDDYVLAACYTLEGINNTMNIKKIRKYLIHWDDVGIPYFKIKNRKYYLNEFQRTNRG